MSKIKVKNFGPIKAGYPENDGWLEIKKVTVFIGNQGSGKSTIAKLISTFTWIEKALVRGDYNKKWFERKNRYLSYHGCDDTVIEYQGDAYSIKYESNALLITKTSNDATYQLPQIAYAPAERNFITYVKTTKELKLSSEALKEFLTEFDNAKNKIKGFIKLPINDVYVEYDKLNDTLNLKGQGYQLNLTEASSGFQSLIPLYLVSYYLANSVKKQSEVNKESMSIETAFINFIEEPEQNLFPTSQWQLLQSLLEFNNFNVGNKLIITTHSPYIVNFLSIAIQGAYLREKIVQSQKAETLLPQLNKVIPEKSLISAEDVVVYQLETEGNIQKLVANEGIPSDSNYLNEQLKEGNHLFDLLLETEEEL